jgi:aryl-alcohol dehydrogenase
MAKRDIIFKVKPGDHVVLSYLSCGVSSSCKKGTTTYCSDFLKVNFSAERGDGSPTMHKNGETIHGVFFGQSSFATHASGFVLFAPCLDNSKTVL